MSWRGWSVFGLLLMLVAVLMLAPAALAALDGEARVATAFAAGAALTGFLAALTLLATYRMRARSETVGEFGVLLAALLLAPAAAAVPLKLAAPFLSAEAAYFEMVSMFTTTGATVFDRPGEVSAAIHLWRGLTAWLGGFIALIMAFALLAPRNLGGYEVQGERERRGAIGRLRGDPVWAGGQGREAAADRVASAIGTVLPVYFGLTAVLAILLISAGQAPGAALVSAMGVMSTSGVSAQGGAGFGGAGLGAEIAAAAFLILASTRHIYGELGAGPLRLARLPSDPEFRVLLLAVFGATLWLFLRHWLGALELAETAAAGSLRAFWGALFTTLSFATTTGVVSANWDAARMWSGLDNPALVLFGLAIMGGGIATTAGGVKLLRAYALFKHGSRELERLVRPSSISSSSVRRRGLRREGAQIAWVFVMMFLLALALSTLAISLTGLEFDESLTVAVAALSNTGPILPAAVEGGSWLTTVTAEGRGVVCLVMVLGRVELLALIAMLNADNWR